MQRHVYRCKKKRGFCIMSRFSRLFILIVLSLLLSSVSAVFAQDARPGLVVAVQGLPPTLEPIRENSNVMDRIRWSLYGTLFELDAATFQVIPGLAESWTLVDDTTLEVKLRDGVLFHNGDPLDAEDVAFTFGPERAFNEDMPGYGNATQFFGTIASVEVVDALTVRFITSQPDPLLVQRLTTQVSGIVNKVAYDEAGDYDAFSRLGIGTGPYRVVEFVTDDVLRLEAFDEYYGGTPELGTLTFQVIPEVSTRVAGLISGDFGIATDLTPDQFSIIASTDDVSIVGGPIRNNRVILYNESDPVLANATLRLAMNYAIDRQLIVDTLFEGRTTVPQGNQFPEFGDMFIEDWQGQGYDLEKAKELVTESGYAGEEIVYRTQAGYYPFQGEIAETMGQMWNEAGINVTVQIMENWDQVLAPEGLQIFDYSTSMYYPDPVGHLWRLWGTKGYFQANAVFINDEFNAMGAILETSTDLTERRTAFRRMLAIYQNEDPSGTYIHQMTIFYGVRGEVAWSPDFAEYMDLRPGKISVQ
jgi:peptide/nickel transport system substrate-binding protein